MTLEEEIPAVFQSAFIITCSFILSMLKEIDACVGSLLYKKKNILESLSLTPDDEEYNRKLYSGVSKQEACVMGKKLVFVSHWSTGKRIGLASLRDGDGEDMVGLNFLDGMLHGMMVFLESQRTTLVEYDHDHPTGKVVIRDKNGKQWVYQYSAYDRVSLVTGDKESPPSLLCIPLFATIKKKEEVSEFTMKDVVSLTPSNMWKNKSRLAWARAMELKSIEQECLQFFKSYDEYDTLRKMIGERISSFDKLRVEEQKRLAELKKQKKQEKRERQAALKKQQEEAKRKAEEEARRKAEEEARRKVEEEKRKAEEARKKAEEEARRKAEEAKKKAEEEARRKAEEARKKAEEEARREAKRQEELRLERAMEELRRYLEEKRKAEEEAKRKAEEERRKAEEAKRIAEEEARKKAEKEAKRKAEEERRKAEEARKLEEQRKQEERRKQAELRRQQKEERKKLAEQKKREKAERRKQAELKRQEKVKQKELQEKQKKKAEQKKLKKLKEKEKQEKLAAVEKLKELQKQVEQYCPQQSSPPEPVPTPQTTTVNTSIPKKRGDLKMILQSQRVSVNDLDAKDLPVRK